MERIVILHLQQLPVLHLQKLGFDLNGIYIISPFLESRLTYSNTTLGTAIIKWNITICKYWFKTKSFGVTRKGTALRLKFSSSQLPY